MFDNKADKLNELLEQRKKKSTNFSLSEEEIRHSAEETDEDLSGLLEVADRLLGFQFSNVPTPNKQRKYLSHTNQEAPSKTFRLVKIFALPVSLAVVILAGLQTYAKSQESLPGSTLYSIKKLSEQASVWKNSGNPETLAYTQLQITEKRLKETQIVLDSKEFDEALKARALEELQKQTETTLSLVRDVVAINKTDSNLVKSLENINQQIKSLPSSDNTGKESIAIASKLKKDSQATTDEVRNMIGVAAEGSVLSLETNKEVQVTGFVTSITKDTIVVEKSIFTFDPKALTIIQGDNTPKFSDIKIATRVRVTGTRNKDGSLVAEKINILAPAKEIEPTQPSEEEVKPEETEPALEQNTKVQVNLLIEDPNPTIVATEE